LEFVKSIALKFFHIASFSSLLKKSNYSIDRLHSLKFRISLTLLLPFILFLFLLTGAHAAEVTLEWDPNSELDLAGYKIYWGTTSGNYISNVDVGKQTTYTITDLSEGQTYYIAAKAYDEADNESGYSVEVSHTIPAPDSDGDGVPDNQDDFPSDPSETTDTDNDGIGNNADTDDDNDGMPDTWANRYGFDPLADDADDDADGDGISNLDEFLAETDPLVPKGNSQPDPPELVSPSHDELVSSTPVLQTDTFYDADFGDFHSETQWQIYRKSDNVCVLDITSANSLTTLEVPKLVLNDSTMYTWKAIFFDKYGSPSEWSNDAVFETEADPEDANDNGIPDHQEVDTLSDLDSDGVPDADQDTIKCVTTTDGTMQIGVSFKDSNSVVAIESIMAEDPDDFNGLAGEVNRPEHLPFGLISFKLIMDQPGDSAEITVYFSEYAPEDGRWVKLDPIEGVWTYYDSANAQFSADRRSVSLYLEDGGAGDADGIVNGIIVDPSGVSVSSTTTSSSTPTPSSGGGGGSGCFIVSAAGEPAIESWADSVHNKFQYLWPAFILFLPALLCARRSISPK